jgi:hypothetical protein
MYQPGISIRKGLPFGLEMGFTGRWIAMSHSGVFSGYVRAGLLDGFQPAPDVNLHIGYSAYLGNPELDLGTLDVGLTIGGNARVGLKAAKVARIAPYADVSLLVISATPKVSADVREQIGALSYGRVGPADDPSARSKSLVVPQFSGGVQINGGRIMIRLNGGYSLKANAYAAVGFGFSY